MSSPVIGVVLKQLNPIKVKDIGVSGSWRIYGADGVRVLISLNSSSNLSVFRQDKLVELADFPVNERIKKLREVLGFTQRDLANVCGITQGEISAIERGSSKPGHEIMKKLMDGLGADWEFFAPAKA